MSMRVFPELTDAEEYALQEEARVKSKHSLHYLAKHLLGYHKMTDDFHLGMAKAIDNPKFRFKLLMYPRGHY